MRVSGNSFLWCVSLTLCLFASCVQLEEDESSKVYRGIRASGGEVWFDPPENLLTTDDKPPIGTVEQIGASRTLVKAIAITPGNSRDLEQLLVFKGLESLILHDVDDELLGHLPEFPNLKMLAVISDNFDGSGIEHLALQPNLSQLHILFANSLSGSELIHLKALSGLTELSVLDCPLNDLGLKHIGDLGTQLHRLELGCWSKPEMVQCESLAPMASLKNLRSLELSWFQLNPTEYKHLSNLTSIERLQIDCENANDEILRAVKGLTNLKSLKITGGAVTDNGLIQLSDLVALETLWIDSEAIKGPGLRHLYDIKSLRHVRSYYASEEAKDDLRRAVPGCVVR